MNPKQIEIAFFVFLALPVFISGCASVPERTAAEVRREIVLSVTSQPAYKQAEPLLLRLRPGIPVDETGLSWAVHNIRQDDKVAGQVSSSNGWVECMSGGPSQAVNKFGSFYGRSGHIAYGMHVFGYVTDSLNIVPKYLVKTQAAIILPSEYERLVGSKTANIGWTRTPGRDTKTYLRGIKVKEVQALDFKDPDPAERRVGEAINLDTYMAKYLTREKFAEAEQDLKQLKKGMGLMEVIRTLGGAFVMRPSGDDFMVFGMKGFLNLTAEYRAWSTLLPGGLFSVWSFGYVEGGKEVPELALIFKNAEVFKIVNYSTRQELEKQCWD